MSVNVKPSRKLEQTERQLRASERAHRVTLAENEQLRGLIEVRGPLREMVRWYAAVKDAAVPLRSKPFDGQRGSGSMFDRPLPYVSTERMRGVGEQADRVLTELAEALKGVFDDEPGEALRVTDICGKCGCNGDHDHRRTAVRAAREFLQDLLADGPVEVGDVYRYAAEEGHAERTVRRAGNSKRSGKPLITAVRRDGRPFWELTNGGS